MFLRVALPVDPRGETPLGEFQASYLGRTFDGTSLRIGSTARATPSGVVQPFTWLALHRPSLCF
jgi:hypothetical protein